MYHRVELTIEILESSAVIPRNQSVHMLPSLSGHLHLHNQPAEFLAH
jgi:hypothetical protein